MMPPACTPLSHFMAPCKISIRVQPFGNKGHGDCAPTAARLAQALLFKARFSPIERIMMKKNTTRNARALARIILMSAFAPIADTSLCLQYPESGH